MLAIFQHAVFQNSVQSVKKCSLKKCPIFLSEIKNFHINQFFEIYYFQKIITLLQRVLNFGGKLNKLLFMMKFAHRSTSQWIYVAESRLYYKVSAFIIVLMRVSAPWLTAPENKFILNSVWMYNILIYTWRCSLCPNLQNLYIINFIITEFIQ